MSTATLFLLARLLFIHHQIKREWCALKGNLESSYGRSYLSLVSFPDPAFKLDKGLAHFARNLGLPDLAGKELSCDNKYIHDSGCGLELKSGLGQGKFVVSQV